MPLLNSILNRIPPIVSLYSNLGFEFSKYQTKQIKLSDFLRNTEVIRLSLPIKTKELIDIVNIETDEVTLANSCADLARRVDGQANAIIAGIVHNNEAAISTALLSIESNMLALISRLTAHYEYISENSQKEHAITDCLKKAFDLIADGPPPVFEDNFDEYMTLANGVNISYSQDERIELNKKILRFPGMTTFLKELSNIQQRTNTLNLVRAYRPEQVAALDPLPRNIHDLFLGTKVFDKKGFSSIEEARENFVNFFKNGNWFESYIFLTLEKAGCSSRLLNALLSSGGITIEADVLAAYSNNLVIFETKDRAFSDRLSASDITDINGKIEKVANLKNPSIKMNFVVNIADQNKQAVEEKIQEISSANGIEIKTIFLDNQGTIDNIMAKIKECLR